MKILNLYAGIGGNRKLWGVEHNITAVELDPNIANVYKEFFPNDTVIIDNALDFLKKNFRKFDFIWASPPCQSHSSFRQNICVRYRNTPAVYPDMSLYKIIIFLQNNFTGKWIVENVKPYYKPLITPTKILQRHLFWCNFNISDKKFKKENIRASQIAELEILHGFNLKGYKLQNKRQILRNCVLPEIGKYILDEMIKDGE